MPDQHPMQKFPLGQIVSTPNCMENVSKEDMEAALKRFITGDWGDCDEEDWEANEQALLHGTRLMGVYKNVDDETFWIITEADRSVTTILLPEDY